MPIEFDRLQQAIFTQLKKDNPGEDNKILQQRSFAIATAQWKKTHSGKAPSRENIDIEKKFTEDGYEIISENTKMFIEGSINSIVE